MMGLSWVAAGVLWSLTIVGIPVGKQCFKFATLCFFPFGKHVIASNNTTGNFCLFKYHLKFYTKDKRIYGSLSYH